MRCAVVDPCVLCCELCAVAIDARASGTDKIGYATQCVHNVCNTNT